MGVEVRVFLRDGGIGLFWASDKWDTADGSCHALAAGKPLMLLMEGRIGQIRYIPALLIVVQMVMRAMRMMRVVVITLVRSYSNQSQEL